MNIKNIYNGIVPLATLVLFALYIVSCEREPEEGIPEITNIRLTALDSSLTSATFETTIAIQGKGLQDVEKVRFNSIDANLNPNYVTSANIIVTVPDSFPSSITNEICLITASEKVYCFPFVIEVPEPQINQIIGTLKSDGNHTLSLFGSGLAVIHKLAMGDTNEVITGGIEITKFTVNSDYTECTFVIPPGIESNDSIIYIVTEAGSASARINLISSFSPIIESVSNQFAGPGEITRLVGINLGGLITLNFGDVGIEGYTSSEIFDYVEFVVPEGIPEAQLTSVYVQNDFGENSFEFMYRDTNNVILDFEAIPPFCWGTDPYQDALDSIALIGIEGYNRFGFFHGEMPPSWWDQDHMFCMCEDAPYPVFSESNVISDFALLFEIDVRQEWSGGGSLYINFMQAGVIDLNTSETTEGEIFNYHYIPYTTDNPFITDGWITVTIPLTDFTVSTRYEGFDVTRLQNMRFKFFHDGSQPAPVDVNINVDNIRINKLY